MPLPPQVQYLQNIPLGAQGDTPGTPEVYSRVANPSTLLPKVTMCVEDASSGVVTGVSELYARDYGYVW